MNELKNIIDQELDLMVPIADLKLISHNVMRHILNPKKSYNLHLAEKKDNFFLLFVVVFCSAVVYFIGYNESTKIKLYISKELLINVLYAFIFLAMGVVLIINFYFDKRKINLIKN